MPPQGSPGRAISQPATKPGEPSTIRGMVTHFEATLTLLGILVGMLGTLIGVVWKARGWVDRLNTTDSDLARAIANLAETMRQLHAENQRRFEGIEQRLNSRRLEPLLG